MLRRLERVFRCYSVCETMKDTKEGYCRQTINIVVTLLLGKTSNMDVLSVTMETHQVHKKDI